MKKLIYLIILAMFLMLFLPGCGEKPSETMNLPEFEKKYKRADYNAFLSDPSSFVSDLVLLNTNTACSPDELPTKDEWTISYEVTTDDGSVTAFMCEKECVLFNKPFSYSANVTVLNNKNKANYTISIRYESGEVSEDLEFARAIYNCFVSKYGDPSEINIEDTEADEPTLIKILNGSSDPQSFSVSFDAGGFLSFYAYRWKAGDNKGTYDSHVTVHSFPNTRPAE